MKRKKTKMKKNKTINAEEVRNFYLKPNTLFRNKNNLGRLTLRRRDMKSPHYRRILLQQINSGIKQSSLEKQLSKDYIEGVF